MSDQPPTLAIWRSLWLPGSETFVADHVAQLQRWRPLPVGLYRQPSGLGPEPLLAPFTRTGPLRYLERFSARTGYRGVFDRMLLRNGAHLIHAHFGKDALDVLPIARRLGLPLLVTFHGYDATSELRRPEYRRDLAEVFDYATGLLPVSHFLAGRLIDAGAPAEKVHVHYLGIPVDDDAHVPDIDQRSGILFVGRLTETKGVDHLLRAVGALPAELRHVPVTIVGDGPERARLQAQAAELDGHQITFTGRVPPARVREAMSHAEVFLGPSRPAGNGAVEGFGLVFAEAASAGTPVIGYASGGVPEAVLDGETGLLAEVDDVSGLTERLVSVLTDNDLARRLGTAGRQRVVRDLNLRTQTTRLEGAYDRVAQGEPVMLS